MNEMKVMLDPWGIMPRRAHKSDAGYDLMTPEPFVLPFDGEYVVDTGVHVQIPEGYCGLLVAKSGLNMKGVTSTGLIDSGYTGSIRVKLYNRGTEKVFESGDKISQLVILPIATPELVIVDEFEATERGDNGFGSTGR